MVSAGGYALSGSDSGNYSLTQPSATANITAASLTITADDATIVYGSGNTDSYTVIGIQGINYVDSVQFSSDASTSGSGSWVVGTWTVTPSDATGSGLSNYTITYVAGTLTINPLALTISDFAVANKTYDGTTDATITDDGTLSGVISGDDVTLVDSDVSASFDNDLVGNNKTVTGSGYSITGSDSSNYTLAQPTTTANITLPGGGSSPTLYWTDAQNDQQFSNAADWDVIVDGNYVTSTQGPQAGNNLVFGQPSSSAAGHINPLYTAGGTGLIVYAGSVSPDCDYMQEASQGDYNSVTQLGAYIGTVTVTGSYGTGTLTLSGGTIDQNADITVTGSFGWNGGTLGGTSTVANLNLNGATGNISPNGGSVITGDNFNLNGAVLNVDPGTVQFSNVGNITLNSGSQLFIYAQTPQKQAANVDFGGATQTPSQITVNPGNVMTVTGPGEWSDTKQFVFNSGGTFTVKGNATASFAVPGQEQYGQASGTTNLYTGSTIVASSIQIITGTFNHRRAFFGCHGDPYRDDG